MATKNKKPAAKKAVAKKPAKKVVKKAAVKAPKKAIKKVVKTVKKVVKKVAPKAKTVKAPVKKAAAPKAKKVVAKPVAKKPVVKAAPKPQPKKPERVSKNLAKSLTKASVNIKPQAQQPMIHQTLTKDLKPLTKEEATLVRYTDKELDEFKQIILDKIEKAKEEISFYQDQIRTTSESETKFASLDDGSVTTERESMNQIIGRQQKLIVHLENALVRIQNKTYGICRETGKLIPKERLRAVPHATLSVEAKKMQK